MSDQKLDHIEEILTHQEKQISDLNDMVTSQWSEIDLLKKQLEKTRAKLDVLEETSGGSEGLSVTDEAALNKPPHY